MSGNNYFGSELELLFLLLLIAELSTPLLVQFGFDALSSAAQQTYSVARPGRTVEFLLSPFNLEIRSYDGQQIETMHSVESRAMRELEFQWASGIVEKVRKLEVLLRSPSLVHSAAAIFHWLKFYENFVLHQFGLETKMQ